MRFGLHAELVAVLLVLACGPPAASPPAPHPSRTADPRADARSVPTVSATPSPSVEAPDPHPGDLPLFADEQPPATIGTLENALGLTFTEVVVHDNDTGWFVLPPPTRHERPDPSSRAEPLELSDDVERIYAAYAFDLYHKRPIATLAELRRRPLENYTVALRRGRTPREARLRERFGAPSTARAPASGSTPAVEYRVYGPFFVRVGDSEAFTLSWYAKLPDWAVVGVVPAVRERFLRGLATATTAAKGRDDVVRVVTAPPPEAGIVAVSARDSISFELAPPVAALDLVRFFGWKNAVGKSLGVHRGTWIVELLGPTPDGHPTKPPTLGSWSITATLGGRASGGAVAGLGQGPVAYGRLGRDDVVRYVSIEPKGE